MKKRIVLYLIFFQIFLIGIIGFQIYHKKTSVLGVSVNPIKKEDIIFSPSSELKYFYEPKASSIVKDGDNTPNQATHTINSDALNSLRDYKTEKPADVYRIIALGDSFTFGMYTDTDKAWPFVLETKLNSSVCSKNKKFEVINLGVGGYDSRYEVERMKKRGLKYDPDLVVWLHTDFSRVMEILSPILNKYNSNYKPTNAKNIYETWIKAQNDLNLTYGYAKLAEVNKHAIESMKEYYKGKVVMVPVPIMLNHESYLILKNIVSKNPNWYYFDKLGNIYEQDASYLGDGHPNPKGHKMIAEDIFNYLKNSNLIPCEQ